MIDHIFIEGWLDQKPLDCCSLTLCGLNQCAVKVIFHIPCSVLHFSAKKSIKTTSQYSEQH